MDKKRPEETTADKTASDKTDKTAADKTAAGAQSANAANPMASFAPMFSLARAGFDEYRVQADRWMEYSAAQVSQGLRAMQQAQSQVLAASLATFDAVEKASERSAAQLGTVASTFKMPGMGQWMGRNA